MYGIKGFGAVQDLPQAFGAPIPCDDWVTWAMYPQCWGYSTGTWSQIRNFSRPSGSVVAPAAVPLAYTKNPTYAGTPGEQQAQYMTETSDVLNQAMAQTQANIAAATAAGANLMCPDGVTTVTDLADCPAGSSFNWWIVAAVGGVFLLGMAIK